jgi:hypothetical protein
MCCEDLFIPFPLGRGKRGRVLGARKTLSPFLSQREREISTIATVEGSETTFNWRIYLVGPRLYQVAVATKKADSTTPEITKFLNSFRLTN